MNFQMHHLIFDGFINECIYITSRSTSMTRLSTFYGNSQAERIWTLFELRKMRKFIFHKSAPSLSRCEKNDNAKNKIKKVPFRMIRFHFFSFLHSEVTL